MVSVSWRWPFGGPMSCNTSLMAFSERGGDGRGYCTGETDRK